MNKVFLIFFSITISTISVFGSGSHENTTVDLYNQALTLYEQQEYEKSDEIIQQIFSGKTEEIPNQTMILSGNNSYKLSSYLSENPENMEKALFEIDKSINWYKRYLDMNPGNKNVSHNMEMALKLKEKLEETVENEKKKQEKNKDQENQLDGLKDEQQKLADDNKKESEDHKSSQEDLNKKTSELSKEMSGENDQFKEQMEKAQNLQKQALDQLEQGDFKSAEDLQQQAAEALENAQNSLPDNNQQPEPSESEGQSESEIDQIARSIIENENNRESSTDKTGEGIIVDRNW
jgi:flagellar biosynthesis GTPase FlhF